MSHATVLVVTKLGQTIDELMAPYDENSEVEPYQDGDEMSTYNPRSKWDWWELGGRWTGSLVAKVGAPAVVGQPGLMTATAPAGTCDQCRFGDVDWDAMRTNQRIAFGKYWDDAGDGARWGSEEIRKLSREDYVRATEEFRTHAVLMPDGVWHEKGKMGWFGITHDEQEPDQWDAEFTELLSTCEDDWTLSVVDYHI